MFAELKRALALIAVLALVAVTSGAQGSRPENQPEKQMTKSSPATKTAAAAPAWMRASVAKLQKELAAKYGDAQKPRLTRGLRQVADFWRAEDGNAAAFEEFGRRNFAGDQQTLDTLFTRVELLFEKLGGHMLEIGIEFRKQVDLDRGPIQPYDEIFAAYDPGAHLLDDFFKNKLAFVVLLNFPLTTLDERLREGDRWTRRQWAEARLAQAFSKRIPAAVNQGVAQALADAEQYIAEYNIWMHHLLDENGQRLFPPKMRLLSHWNLRDQIKADYSEPNGLPKQRMIQQVTERIVTQSIPAAVINNPGADWNPYTNEVKATALNENDGTPKPIKVTAAPEPDTRYAVLLKNFRAVRKIDAYSPTARTHIARRFDEDRELPEARVKAMLEQIVSSPMVPRVAALIEKRLGRKLEPFDIWYHGFRPRGAYTEAQLDEIVRKKYPTAEAYRADMPNLLVKLGFTRERAEYLTNNILVEPARGSGHAAGAAMRGAKARLRTRVEKGGMDYKGFNIAVHEMGHNVEQTFSLNDVDHTLLQGVPNTAFTEALAFVFQAKDLELLGLASPDAESVALQALHDFWQTYEIAGVALVDMGVWHWLYDHPNATPAELKAATLGIARDVWNGFYAPVFGKKDVVLLAVYSHMLNYPLYLPDYPIGHLIAHQIEEQIRKSGNLGTEFERMARQGRLTPDLWMRSATGAPVGAEALLAATEHALTQIAGAGR
jgi:hypothetical protein